MKNKIVDFLLKFSKRKLYVLLFVLQLVFSTVLPSDICAKTKIDTDYILIINTYTEASDWSNKFISSAYEFRFASNSEITVYVEHMSMLMINTGDEMNQYKKQLFKKYSERAPKAIMLLGNTPWATMREELESMWPNTPIILCAEENYIGPSESYIVKTAIAKEDRVPLESYNGPLRVSIIYDTLSITETVELMKQLIPGMDNIMFLSDSRYISIQARADLAEILKEKHPELKLRNQVSDSISINGLADTLRGASPSTGVLFLSWYTKNYISGNTVLTSSEHKMFSSYTTLPIFTLTDNTASNIGLLGGYFIGNMRIGDAVKQTLQSVLSGEQVERVKIIDVGSAKPILNYLVLTDSGLSEELCPDNTEFHFKQLTIWQANKNLILFCLFVLVSGIGFLMVRMQMLAKTKAIQGEQIIVMTNYRSLFDNMPIAYAKQQLVFDNGRIVDYIVTEVNPYFEKYFTSNQTPLTSHKRMEASPLKDFIEIYEIALADGKEITVQYYHQSSGRYFSVIVVPSKVYGFMDVFYVDNTELSTTQQLLRTLNHKLSMALEVANITPWKWDLDKGVIICDVNRMVDSASKDRTDEQMSVPYDSYFSTICKRDLNRVREAYKDLLSGKINKAKEEYRVFTHDGNKRSYEWVESQAVIDKRDENGRPLSLIGSSLVISDRKKMESDLVEAKERAEESNRLKSAFLANMSHEIRTPLNAIIGFSGVLASTENEEDKHEYVSIIENNNTLLLQLISDILDLSKIEAGTLEFVYANTDLHDLFAELETSLKMRVSDNIEIIYDRELPECCTRIDKNRLTQVVVNMVNNAIKFTSEGSIRFGYKLQDDKTLYFHITDTGTGIPADKIESVFQRFVKLDSFVQGTGLGLSICQTIIHHMGGEVGVESEVGKGSTFWFTIPYDPVVVVPKVQNVIVQEVIERDKLTVLIAEDNASNYILFETILKGEYRIVHAWDGEEAVKLFSECNPHIVLMDINMPKMNGYEATKLIKEMSPSVPIIAVTAYAYASDEQRINESEFDGYAAKPINSQILKTLMMNLLKRRLIFV